MSKYNPIRVVSSISAAKRAYSERSYDFIIINSPLPDDSGYHFAVDMTATGVTVPILLIPSVDYDDVFDRVAEHGVFTLSMPFSKATIIAALDWMCTAREKLRKNTKKTLSIEEKMDEIRIVNRAKWLLISELKMTEPDAHRYIEKQAMDRCEAKRVIAEEIIKTYQK